MLRTLRLPLLAFGSALALAAAPLPAGAFPFATSEIEKYLLIGNGPVNDVEEPDPNPSVGIGQASNTNNFELGANRAPVPSTSDFLDGGSSGGPSLAGNVPDLPDGTTPVGGITPVFQGVSSDGNVAITHAEGVFNFQDVGVYADPNIGIQCAGSVSDCDDGTSNSFFNDPNMFPNTFDTNTQMGTSVNPGDADQTTRIDDPNFAGVTGNVDFSDLLDQLDDAAALIPTLAPQGFGGGTLDLSGTSGEISTDTLITLMSGLNVIDIDTGGSNDFLLNGANLVIDGPSDAFAIFRLGDESNMLISNGNILIGDDGIGLHNVIFFSDNEDTDTHFNFSNTVLNGVAFWSLRGFGGEINIDNAQGCTQFVADKITLNDVRFTRCAAVVPEPSTLPLAGLGLAALALWLRLPARRRAES